jgi:HEAT repeat protein
MRVRPVDSRDPAFRRMARLAAALVACSLVAACARPYDPAAARREFSTKDQSIARAERARRAASLELAVVAEGPVELAAPRTGAQQGIPVLSDDEQENARRILREASRSEWAMLRANAVEASTVNPSLLAELAPAALADPNRGVRFVACMAIAEARVPDLCALATPLLLDESPSVQAAALLALSRCGQSPDLTPLAAMCRSDDPEVRGNAYLVLGALGNDSARALILDSLGKGMRLVNPIRVRLVDLSAAEALVRLGDNAEIEPIRAALFAPPEQSELSVVACDIIGELRDEVSRPMLERLVNVEGENRRSPEIRLAAARALLRIGGSPEAATLVAAEYLAHPDARVRAQVAAVLADARTPAALAALTSLIRDADPTVQVAAAGGIDAVHQVAAAD